MRSLLCFLPLACLVCVLASAPVNAQKTSGFEQMGRQIQALQKDDSQNPAMLWVAAGEKLWRDLPASASGRQPVSCQQCHGDASVSMRGVAAGFPRFSSRFARPITLAQQVNLCRSDRQGLAALTEEHADLLGLTAFIGLQSRGMPIVADPDPRSAAFRQRGERLFQQRIGQLDLSCAQCHDQRAGLRLGGSLIPEGHASGYPIYRLEWQGMGSLQRRLRNCMTGVRAEPFEAGALQWTELELHLMQRAQGMRLETPAVRP